ncbi:MAG: hypothetical protein IJQ59_07050 [Bacteroidaceae bacterium]|nr:hypothetical protein [Bacteroidaceae bacterium]
MKQRLFMKRLFVAFLFATVSFVSSFAQPLETPVCYAFTEGYVSTLKYKFSYENEKYFIDLRLVGHGNSLKGGDQVVFVTQDGTKHTYVIPEKEEEPEYYLIEVNYTDILQYQDGLKSITLVKDGKSQPMEITRYCNQRTKKGAKGIIGVAYSLEKKKGHLSYKSAIEGEKQKLEEERLKTVQAKAKVLEEEKALDVIMPDVNIYHRVFVGYAPTQYNSGRHAEGFTFGYTGGVCLAKKSMVYLEFGVQGDFYRFKGSDSFDTLIENLDQCSKLISAAAKQGGLSQSEINNITTPLDAFKSSINQNDAWNAFAISVPIAITKRIELGHSGATLSPFIGPMVRFNVRESGSDIFQIGGQGGINLDYKHLNIGVAYHLEAWTNGNRHTRGLAIRLGYTF